MESTTIQFLWTEINRKPKYTLKMKTKQNKTNNHRHQQNEIP